MMQNYTCLHEHTHLIHGREHYNNITAAKKVLIQVEYIGNSNNYYEDIYIPPYNNTD